MTWGDQARTYALLCLTGDLQAEDLLAAQVEIKSLMDEAPQKVSVVADFSEIERVSSQLLIEGTAAHRALSSIQSEATISI